MYHVSATHPVLKAASLWRDAAAAYGGMHPAEINPEALARARTADAIIIEVERAWHAIPENHRTDPDLPPQRIRLNGGLPAGALCLTFGGGRSTVNLAWTPGSPQAWLSVRWVPTTGFFGEDYTLASPDDPDRCVETNIRQLDPKTTWHEWQPRFEAAGFTLPDLEKARTLLLGDHLDVAGQVLNELACQNGDIVDSQRWRHSTYVDPRIAFLEEALRRVLEGRMGRDLEGTPTLGPTWHFATSGVAHALGHNFWRWEGEVTQFPLPHESPCLYLQGTLYVMDEEGNDIDEYPYSRSFCPSDPDPYSRSFCPSDPDPK
jgi:hypothetical protein